MKSEEKLAKLHLEHIGCMSILYEPDGNIPPDFLVNGEIAVEVRRLNQHFKNGDAVEPLEDLIRKYQSDIPKEDAYFLKEFVLWGLVEYNKLSKDRFVEGYQFKDLYGSYISKL